MGLCERYCESISVALIDNCFEFALRSLGK
ncbi:MAG: hypothetical protein MOIL_01064 [Candidatus Methanolliviera sp. GoM_oil]|nr:MAG: hypothetical protein MOIL_01064 [Candidatus Methanolliviera sp. GoM_oil]VUT26104.1 MAG: hypothetical protein MASP_01329 [Candidatus Methanolliviera sp. GoM_asphalt]